MQRMSKRIVPNSDTIPFAAAAAAYAVRPHFPFWAIGQTKLLLQKRTTFTFETAPKTFILFFFVIAVVPMFGSALLFLSIFVIITFSVCVFLFLLFVSCLDLYKHTYTFYTIFFHLLRFAFLSYMVVVVSFHSHWKSFKQQMHKLLLNFILLFLWEIWCLRTGREKWIGEWEKKKSEFARLVHRNRKTHILYSSECGCVRNECEFSENRVPNYLHYYIYTPSKLKKRNREKKAVTNTIVQLLKVLVEV